MGSSPPPTSPFSMPTSAITRPAWRRPSRPAPGAHSRSRTGRERSRRMCSLTVAFVLLTLASAAPSQAGPPFLWQSWVDPTLVACPAGDSLFLVVPWRYHPLMGAVVDMDFSACAGAQFAPPDGTEGYQFGTGASSRVAFTFSDNQGRAEFRLRAGGTCGAGLVQLYADGESFGVRALASCDQDGNLSVGPEDVAMATAKLGSSDPTADFDGDGAVTAADLAILNAHLGHHAPGMATPVAARTWGTLKITYR